MDVKGQLSAEYILILGFMLVIVMIFASIVGPEIEQNSVMSAARDGASNALANISITNSSVPPIRVTSMNMTGNNSKVVYIKLSGIIPGSYNATVLNDIINYVVKQGFTKYNNTTVKGNNFNYTFVLVS
jgi:uncharacterized protein (UPF0333 family)